MKLGLRMAAAFIIGATMFCDILTPVLSGALYFMAAVFLIAAQIGPAEKS